MTDTAAAAPPTADDPMAAARAQLAAETEPEAAAPAAAAAATPAADGEPVADAATDEVLTEDDLFAPEDDAPPVVSPYDKPGKWFVVHTQSGYENKVKENLQARQKNTPELEEAIYEIEIPMEDVIEFKAGRKVVVRKKVFPGYLLIRCKPSDDTHHLIRATPGITGYAGPGGKPSPLRRREVESFLSMPEVGEEKPLRTKPSVSYELDESVRIKDGPFADFQGQVIEINEDQLRVKVLVNIFGRETPVELEFAQVAKV